MVAHELATLNDTREENAELKRTAEGLRKKIDTLSQESAGKDIAIDAFMKAVAHIGGKQLVKAVTAAAHDILGIGPKDAKPEKKRRNSSIQIVPANTKIIQ